MDLDADGALDILSGSYSRMDEDMAGVLQVLWGESGGTFRPPEPLRGSDGKDVVLPRGDDDGPDVDRICTRPFAADLDGDLDLDLVVGNFAGTFGFFRGKGAGEFEPRAEWLMADGERMEVPMHGDPFLVDWDGDGDLDILFVNVGSRTAPGFGPRRTLVEPMERDDASAELGDGHLKGPGSSTRVWCDDVDGDGKLDLLLGDNVTLYHAAEGVAADVARAKLAQWRADLSKLFEDSPDDFSERYQALEARRDPFVTEDRTGFVWVLYQE